MPLDFTAQATIVTGAGSGIGRATAILLARRGAGVLVNDPAPDGRAQDVVEEIQAFGGHAVAETTPVRSHDGARAIAAATREAFGSIDILVNNAGIARPAAFGESEDGDIDCVLATNLLGPYAMMRAVWPDMRAQKYGRILNMSSSAAFGSGISGPYAASKAGLIGLTKDAAISGASQGISVNALMPSAFTPLLDNHPDPAFRAWMRANMPAESVAAVVAWLVSRSSQVSGELFTAGGGHVSRIAFIESAGVVDRDLTPEGVGAALDQILDLDKGSVITTQQDHQEVYARLFPDCPVS